jgi:hypothetical protein
MIEMLFHGVWNLKDQYRELGLLIVTRVVVMRGELIEKLVRKRD